MQKIAESGGRGLGNMAKWQRLKWQKTTQPASHGTWKACSMHTVNNVYEQCLKRIWCARCSKIVVGCPWCFERQRQLRNWDVQTFPWWICIKIIYIHIYIYQYLCLLIYPSIYLFIYSVYIYTYKFYVIHTYYIHILRANKLWHD